MPILTGKTNHKFRHSGKNKHKQRGNNSFKISKNKALIHRRDDSQVETEVSNDVGTTDVPAEELITSGEIPNEMYEIENTPARALLELNQNMPSVIEQHSSRSRGIQVNNQSTHPSVLLIIAIITGSLIILICLVTCIIAKVKKKNYKTLSKKDVECCTVNRPLLSMCEEKDSSSSTCCRK